MKKRVAVLVSGGGTNLQALIDASSRGELQNAEIVAVISSSSKAYALERAANANIPTWVIAKKDWPDREAFTEEYRKTLREIGVDIVVLAGFLYIFTASIFEEFPWVINVHPALIPAFCGDGFYGIHVHEKVLEAGVKVTGATVHLVTKEVDAGPILLQKAVEISPDDTPESLQKKVMQECEWKLLPKAVSLVAQDRVQVLDAKHTRIVECGEGE